MTLKRSRSLGLAVLVIKLENGYQPTELLLNSTAKNASIHSCTFFFLSFFFFFFLFS